MVCWICPYPPQPCHEVLVVPRLILRSSVRSGLSNRSSAARKPTTPAPLRTQIGQHAPFDARWVASGWPQVMCACSRPAYRCARLQVEVARRPTLMPHVVGENAAAEPARLSPYKDHDTEEIPPGRGHWKSGEEEGVSDQIGSRAEDVSRRPPRRAKHA